ncbi:MAG: hypothetical protein PHV18_04380 [Lachnospiraceae bacterium]|nr:hypothetical protein [Lachnospiraceae bacterium]
MFKTLAYFCIVIVGIGIMAALIILAGILLHMLITWNEPQEKVVPFCLLTGTSCSHSDGWEGTCSTCDVAKELAKAEVERDHEV